MVACRSDGTLIESSLEAGLSRLVDASYTGNEYGLTVQSDEPGRVSVGARGESANVDIHLIPEGAGLVRFGPYSEGSVTPGGYLTLKDDEGHLIRIAAERLN